MAEHSIVFSIFLIFTGAALLATLALYARQAMIVAYIILGALLGPSGVGLVDDSALIEDIAHVGIIFLLFLLGLNLLPQKLIHLLRETTLVTIASTALFGALGFTVARLVGLPLFDCVVVGLATTFSSTIIGLKLLPTTVLHHRHTGEVIVSVLLLQDLIAIVALLVLHGLAHGGVPVLRIGLLLVALPALTGVAWLLERYVLNQLFLRFDRIQEYIFLLSIGWCLGLAQAADSLGLSYEIGAFIAGITIATSPIARHIAESLKPLRDFFLVMFFFALGAGFDWNAVERMLLPAAALAVLVMALKPVIFRFLFVGAAESDRLAWETGVRLGQMSEFSLLIVFVALEAQLVGEEAASLVQVATVLTFIASTYLIVLRYPTPIAISDRLRRD